MVDTVVIGGGLFGRVIAEELSSQGHDVVVLDAKRVGAGSLPAACLMKPSWFSGLGKDIYEPSLTLLDRNYGVEDLDFRIGKGGLAKATVHWVRPSKIFCPSSIVLDMTATFIRQGYVQVMDRHGDSHDLYTRNIVVATGVWANELLNPRGFNVDGLSGQAGTAFLWASSSIKYPFVKPWAPYRQLVAFNRGDGLWMGDGTSIKWKNWTDEREETSWRRCLNSLPNEVELMGEGTSLFGVRPQIRGVKHAYLNNLGGNIWVATGGAKNGTIGAGYCAHVIGRALQ